MDLRAQKQALRAEVRRLLPAPGSARQREASGAAQDRLAASELLRAARVIGLYRALPSECGTASLASALVALGRQVCYPVVLPGAHVLTFRRATGAFLAGPLGVEEPTGPEVPLQDIDLLVVPAQAVDLRCRRLGRGRGHYDATLRLARAVSVALVFEVQLVEEVPVGQDDEPVDAVCTEQRLVVPP